MLTMAAKKAYSVPVEAKSLTSFDRLKYRSAQALNRSVFFYAQKPSYGGLCGGSTERRFSGTVLSILHNLPPSCLTATVAVLRIYQRTSPCLIFISYTVYVAYLLACLSIPLSVKLGLKESWWWIMNNVYSFATGKCLHDEDHQEFIKSLWLKFGLQKEIRTRRKHAVKRGPWAYPDNPFRKWHKQGDKACTRYPYYQINARYPDCEGAC